MSPLSGQSSGSSTVKVVPMSVVYTPHQIDILHILADPHPSFSSLCANSYTEPKQSRVRRLFGFETEHPSFSPRGPSGMWNLSFHPCSYGSS